MIQTEIQQQRSISQANDFISKLNNFIEEKHLPKVFAPGIADKNFIENNPLYYTYYPYLFSNAFQIYDQEVLDQLSIAGFLYYKAVIVLDRMFDTKQPQNLFENYLISDVCKEEAIKLLSDLFPSSHEFWKFWNGRKLEYIKAYEIDQKSHSVQSFEDFEQLADFKCAFGKVAVDALFHLSDSKDEEVYTNILASHKLYYAAFQIEDDINDFVEDYENKQFNIALFELEKHLGKERVANSSVSDLKKLLYLENIADALYNKALQYLERAQEYVRGYDVDPWNYELQKLYNTITIHQLNVDGFIKVFCAKQSFSNLKKSSNSLDTALTSAVSFIKKNQDKIEGNWNDFFNDAGVSDVWSTAYILSQLNEQIAKNENIAFDQAVAFLQEHKNTNKLWGYNSTWISDADSSTFAMLGLLNNGVAICDQTLDVWLSYQNSDGGFATYNNKDEVIASLNSEVIENVDGWVQSHFCVSAAAYLLLCKTRPNSTSFTALREYLIKNLQKDTATYSYWWTENVYAYNLIIKGALHHEDHELFAIVISEIETYLDNHQYQTLIDQNNFFYLGLVLDTLNHSEYLQDKYDDLSEALVNVIVSSQLEDGSWPESYALRIPHPQEVDANSKEIFWQKGDKGTNIILSDFHRLFTTTTCVTALEGFQQKKLVQKGNRAIGA